MTAPERRRPEWSGDERSQLGQILDYNRATVRIKATGLSDEQARQRLTPSPLTSIAGVVVLDLDHIPAPDPQQPISVRSTLLHMVEETARHVGQLDILRELTDGATGE